MKLTIALICATLLSINCWAQQINGKVVDDKTNAPMIGATVKSSANTYTTTDKEGKFTLSCQDNLDITISFIGYKSYNINAAKCGTDILARLSTKENAINQVEVHGNTSEDKELLEVPEAMVKLGETELKRGDGLSLESAINANVPGVYMEKRTASGGQQINIRGYGNGLGFKGASNNFNIQGSKVYLNGIPITDAEGVTVLDDIDFASIGKVEVSKGPSGSLYGLAIAGVINLETQKAKADETSVGENFTVGSYGLLRSTTNVSIGGENSSLLVNYGYQEFDSYMNHNASHKDFVNVMGDFSINPKQSISTYFGYSNSYDERNGQISAEMYENYDYSGKESYIQNDAHSAIRTFRAGISHLYKFNENISNNTTFFGSSQANDEASSGGGWSDSSPLSFGLRSTLDMNFDLSEKVQLSSVSGVELQKTQSIASSFKMVPDSTNLGGYNTIGDLRSNQYFLSSTATYFTQWTVSLPKDFSVIAGVSLSSMTLINEDRLWAKKNNTPGNTVPRKYERTFDGLISPTFSINKKINEVASVYATYSIAYKTPVGSEFYIPYTNEVNGDLKAEKGAQIEVGTKGSMLNNRLYYSVALFNAQFSNKLTTVVVQDQSNTNLYAYTTNGGAMENNGLEALVKYEAMKKNKGFVRSVKPFANLTYSDFKYKDFSYENTDRKHPNTPISEDYSGNTVAGVPKIVYNVGVDVDTKIGLYANVNYHYKDKMYFTSDEQNETNSFGLLNAKIGYRKSIKHFGFELFAGANNITDEQSYYMVFINQMPDVYVPAPSEINYYGGINVKYKF